MGIPEIDAYESAMRRMENMLRDSAFETIFKIDESINQIPTVDAYQNSIELLEKQLNSVIPENMIEINETISQIPAIEACQNPIGLLENPLQSMIPENMIGSYLSNPAIEACQNPIGLLEFPLQSIIPENMIGSYLSNPAIEACQIPKGLLENPFESIIPENMIGMSETIYQTPAIEACQNSLELLGNQLSSRSLEFESQLNEMWIKDLSTSDLQLGSISQIPWNEIGIAIVSENDDMANIAKSFIDYSNSYSTALQEFKIDQIELPSVVPDLAARGFFITTDLIKDIFTDESYNEREENKVIRYKTYNSVEDEFLSLLSELKPELYNIWIGARNALNSNNPDKNRHLAVSLRELFTHILRELAPDEEIKSWSINKNDFHEGKPTRKGRLRYIYRSISEDPLESVISKRISLVIEIIDILSRGTHELKFDIDDKQLNGLMILIESAIAELIQTSLLNN